MNPPWNAATVAHKSHKPDQAGYLRGGGSTLVPDETDLLGQVRGKDVLHLLCNSGQDTPGIAALGAAVTGVDISDEAIDFARRLSAESGIPAAFERSDVYPWLQHAAAEGRAFDVVFCSYGALCWLQDLDEWLRLVAAVLKPGGRFVCIEFHPFAMVFDEQGVPNPHPAFEFQHGLGKILGGTLRAGLVMHDFREYLHSSGWKPYADMKALPGRRWTMPEGKPSIPLMFGLVAGL